MGLSKTMSKDQRPDSFAETARKIGADESDDALDKAFGKLDVKRSENKSADKPEQGATKQRTKNGGDKKTLNRVSTLNPADDPHRPHPDQGNSHI